MLPTSVVLVDNIGIFSCKNPKNIFQKLHLYNSEQLHYLVMYKEISMFMEA